MIVPDNQNVARDRTVAGHVALRGCPTAVARHQTLRATLDWSYETLRRAERTALCKLAVFTTTFDTQAACALMVDEEIKATDVPERYPQVRFRLLTHVADSSRRIRLGSAGSFRPQTRRLQPVHERPFIEAELSFGAAGRGHACRECRPKR
jgi:hypothetical protein